MFVTISITGKTPLLMHDIRLADPDNEWAKAIGQITSKRKKTEEDRREIERLEWFGGLVVAPGIIEGPAYKTEAVRKCLINAGKITKQGTQLGRALTLVEQFVPLVYDGPRNVEKLYDLPAFRHRACVGVGTSRVMRMRPQFFPWSLSSKMFFLENVMDIGDLERIVELAGNAEGLGDNRINGYGRFIGKVTVSNGN